MHDMHFVPSFVLSRRGEIAKHKKQDDVQSLFLILNGQKFVGLTWLLTLIFLTFCCCCYQVTPVGGSDKNVLSKGIASFIFDKR